MFFSSPDQPKDPRILVLEEIFRREWELTFRGGLSSLEIPLDSSEIAPLQLASLGSLLEEDSLRTGTLTLLYLPNYLLWRSFIEIFQPEDPFSLLKDWCGKILASSLCPEGFIEIKPGSNPAFLARDEALSIASLIHCLAQSKTSHIFCYLASIDLSFQGRPLRDEETRDLASHIFLDPQMGSLSSGALRQRKSRISQLLFYGEELLEYCYIFGHNPLNFFSFLKLREMYLKNNLLSLNEDYLFQRAFRGLVKLGFRGFYL